MTITVRVPKFGRPRFPKVTFPSVPRNVAEIATQAIGMLTLLVGVSMWSVPSAFILGGLTVVLAVERQT